MMEKNVIIIHSTKKKEMKKKNKKIRVAAYCRVSTDQEEQLSSFENQVTYYQNLIANNPDYELVKIYADEGISGTGTKQRKGFLEMVEACRNGKVDLVITKSVSRFARNTADSLMYARELKSLGVNILFEKEGIQTMDSSGELLFTILSSLSQEESRNISENTKWGIQSRFKRGLPHINTDCFMGYDKDEEGNLTVNQEQAVIVRRIYEEYLEGWSEAEIARRFTEEHITGIKGRTKWFPETIFRMLQNEKYKGDLLLQKYYTEDYLTKVQHLNRGEYDQYFVKGNHEAIVSEETWEAAQQEILRRRQFREKHHICKVSGKDGHPFHGKVFCGECGNRYARQKPNAYGDIFWKCRHHPSCHTRTKVSDREMMEAFIVSWNQCIDQIRTFEQIPVETVLLKFKKNQFLTLFRKGKINFFHSEYARICVDSVSIQEEYIQIIYILKFC